MNEENNKLNNNKKDKILDVDPSQIDFSNPEKVKELFLMLLNAYGKVLNENTKLREDNQKLRDEINKLKGEKGKPEFKPNKNNDDDFSEEDEEECNSKKKRKKKRDRKSKKNKINIDRKEKIKFSKEEKKDLPSDIKFKGYRTAVVQGIKIITDNVELKIPRYWSPSEKKSYEPKLPDRYSLGEYNAEIHAFVLMLYFMGRVTQPKIVKILNEIGIIISDSKVLDIINRDEEKLSKEKMDIFNAGLKTTSYHQTDDTGLRVSAKNCYMNVYCNPYYTVFIINTNKKRETIKEFIMKLGGKIFILIADDAPQFKNLTELLMLCWIHEGRHYKKLNPILSFQKIILNDYLDKFWEYYDKLKEYKQEPTKTMKKKLDKDFDELFNTVTGYEELDHRIELTKAKKENLLVVLEHPEVPLHNNASEGEIREPVIKRKVSHGVKSEKGKLAWENHFTIQMTCRKQRISYWEYMKNKLSGIEQRSLAERVLAYATA